VSTGPVAQTIASTFFPEGGPVDGPPLRVFCDFDPGLDPSLYD